MRTPVVICVLGAFGVFSACTANVEPTNQHAAGGARDAGATVVGAGVTTGSGSGGDVGSGGATAAGSSSSATAAGVGGASGASAGGSGGAGTTGGAAGSAGSGGTGGTEPGDAGTVDAGPTSSCPLLTAGWSSYQPTTTLQCEGGDAFCTYVNSGGIELFKITKNPANVRQRLEQRVHNDYQSGMNQFEGDLRVTSGDGTTVHQVFKFLMLVAYPQNGGELHQHSQTFLASQVFGTWIHVNTIHDVGTGKTDVYLDCVMKTTMSQSPPDSPGGWYNKYGVYNLGGREAQSEWTNVRYYRK
jgi:hypothetical protein